MRPGIAGARRRAARLALAAAAAAAALALSFPLYLLAAAAVRPLDAAAFRAGYAPSTRIYDRSGILLREAVNANGNRANPLPLGSASPALVDAILAAEDSDFWRHGAVDWLAALRALASNLAGGRIVSGASTITMQVARIAFGAPRTLSGKIAQAVDATRLGAALTKAEILEHYLNRVPFGPGCEGVEAASRKFCGLSAADLGAAEAALLAGMIQSPSLYWPERNPEEARKRRDWVLGRMAATGRLSRADCEAAMAEPLPAPPAAEGIKAGHFTDWVLSLPRPAGDVTTTLDWPLQEQVQRISAEYVRRSAPRGLTNAAVVVLDNASGAVVAMVGSKEWSGEDGGFVNGALALRQPGSALKPFAYELAFERGRSPASMLADVETEYVGDDKTLYIPSNYSRTFRGPVIAKEALAYSLNVPAVRLAREIGVEDLLDRLRSLGFSSLDRGAEHYGLGLVLGDGEVSLLELAGAYAALARGGLYLRPRAFGEPEPPVRVMDEAAAYLVTSILSEDSIKVMAAGSDTPLLAGFPVATKTGTSSNWRDSWTVGYTAEFTVAAWCGDFEAASMNQLTGWTGAGPLCLTVARYMAERLGRQPLLPEPPEGLRKAIVCAESGGVPSDFCPRRTTVTLREGDALTRCAVHRMARVDALTGEEADRSTPPGRAVERLVYSLPPEFDRWLGLSGHYSPPPKPARPGAGPSPIAITSPMPGDVFVIEPGYDARRQSIRLAALSKQRRAALDWYVDGARIASVPWPYEASWTLSKGRHTVTAVSGDSRSEAVSFEVR